MKKNVTQAITLLNQVIQLVGDDFTAQEARTDLVRALNKLQKVDSKRHKRQTAADEYAKLAKENNEKWWQGIVNNSIQMSKDNIKKDL